MNEKNAGDEYRGKAVRVNADRGLVTVSLEDAGFGFAVVRGRLPLEVEKGDVLAGPLRSLGDRALHNETKGSSLEATVLAHDLDKDQASALLDDK